MQFPGKAGFKGTLNVCGKLAGILEDCILSDNILEEPGVKEHKTSRKLKLKSA